jgi:broad specificity phosphatase PhoE
MPFLMIKTWFLTALATFAAFTAVPAAAQSNVYVMRHLNTPAGQPDPDLLPEGRRAAEALAGCFQDERPVAIYVTDYKRTRQTVAPLAARLGLIPIVYNPADTPGLIARVRAEHGAVLVVGQRSVQSCSQGSCQRAAVLVVGHSNTVPDIIEQLGGVRPAPLNHEDFGDLWRIDADGTTTRIRIRDGQVLSVQRR